MACNQVVPHDAECQSSRSDVLLSARIDHSVLGPIDGPGAEIGRHIADDNLTDPEILRLSHAITLREDDTANAAFPARRLARVAITLLDGRHYESDWSEARWDAAAPPSEKELREKYHALADPVLGPHRAGDIESAIETLDKTALSALSQHILCPL